MLRYFRYMLVGIAAVLLEGCVVAEGDRWSRCGKDVRLQVVDLSMSPDPINDGQRVREWKVRLRADERTRCETVIQIRERPGNELAGRDRVSRLRGGINDIEIDPSDGYRFSRKEHCFAVVANIEGTGRSIDASRRFCARQIAGRRWTLKD
jgi:hypothetical protein